MQDTPHIVVCLPATERALSEKIAREFNRRGLHMSLVTDAIQLRKVAPFAAICVGITSKASNAQLVRTAIWMAQEAQRPIFPLLLSHQRDIPPSLKQTQWSNFTGDFWLGWRDLLMALDSERLSRWPYDPTTFDADVVLARAQVGMTPRDWKVYRGFSRLDRPFTGGTLLACFSVIVISWLTWLVNPSNWLAIVLCGSLGMYICLHDYRDKLWGVSKDGTTVVITPRGFVCIATTGTVSYAFTALKSLKTEQRIQKQGETTTTITCLAFVRNDGTQGECVIPSVFDKRLGFVLAPPPAVRKSLEIANAIVAAFQQAQQYVSEQSLTVQKPLVFVSYSHKDERRAGSVELTMLNNGVEPWVDHSRLRVGMRWEHEIKSAIEQCSAVVLLISPDSKGSTYVQFECETAVTLNKPVIGVLVKKGLCVPKSLRPFIRTDKTLPYATAPLTVLHALEQVGILPEEFTTRGEGAAAFVLARAMSHAPLPDEKVFHSNKISQGNLVMLLLAGICVAMVGLLSSNLVFPLYLFSLVLFPRWLFEMSTLMRELIVIYPTGIAKHVNRRATQVAFAPGDSWEITSSSWLNGTACQLDAERFVNIPPRFYHHRQIAQHMVEAFQRSQR